MPQKKVDLKWWLRRGGPAFLTFIGLREGQTVLEFGCGEGNYTIPAAKVVGPGGKVYAIDKDSTALEELIRRAKRRRLKNIEAVQTEGELCPLSGQYGIVDTALIFNMLHYIEDADDRKRLYSEVHRVLRRKGILAVFIPKSHRMDMKMKLKEYIVEVESVGFRLEEQIYKKLWHVRYTKDYVLSFRLKAPDSLV